MAANYYETLGVGRQASKQEIKKLIRSWLRSGIPMSTKPRRQKPDSRKQPKRMKCWVMKRGGKSMMRSCATGPATLGQGVRGAAGQPPPRPGNRLLARAGAAALLPAAVFPKRICSGCSSAAGGSGPRRLRFLLRQWRCPPRGSPWADEFSTMQAQLEITLEQAYKGGNISVQAAGKDLSVQIPARSSEGTVIRVPGGGSGAGQGGDLLVSLHLLPHDIYEPDGGGDLLGTVEIAPGRLCLAEKPRWPCRTAAR